MNEAVIGIDRAQVQAARVAACGTVSPVVACGSVQAMALCEMCSLEFPPVAKPEFGSLALCEDCVRFGRILQAAFMEKRERAEALCENPRADEVRRRVRGLQLVAHDQMAPEDEGVEGVEFHVPSAVTSFLSRERWWLTGLGTMFAAVVWVWILN